MEFEVIQGDIAVQHADALVNAAGTSLRMGSGVAGALRRGAGFDLREGAGIIREVIRDYEPATPSDVRFIAYSDDEFETIRAVADEVRGE